MKWFEHKNFWRILFGILILVAIVLIVRFLQRIAPKKDPMSEIKINTSELSFPQSQYMLWADQLYSAMRGWGVSKNSIFAVIEQLRTKADWDQLVKTYGVRQIKTWWWNTSNGTLPASLRDELSTSSMDRINRHLANFGVRI